MRLSRLIIASCLVAGPCWPAEERISGLLRSMADGGPIPTEKAFYDTVDEDYVNQLSSDSVREFLPLAGRLLGESRPEARKYGLMCFLAVTLRRSLDSEPLLEPYVPELLAIAGDRAGGLRAMAMHVLGSTWPEVSPRTIAYLATHLADKDNTPEEAGWMACTLLRAGSDAITHDVVAFVRKQDQHEIVLKVLQWFHVHPARNADALAFIGASLDSPDVWIRRTALEAVGRVSLADRSPFLTQLNRLSTDPNEPPEVRSAAAEVLKQ